MQIAWLVERLLKSQNADGGWGYQAGRGSWCEPSAMAMLALHGSGGSSLPQVRKALDWMLSARLSDGGWSPNGEVHESTWVTALCVLVLHRYGRLDRNDPGIAWMLRLTGEESTWTHRLRRWLMGHSPAQTEPSGWPWYPGAAAWVVPTALSVMTLDEIQKVIPGSPAPGRVSAGRDFLLSRRCADGGWNHGGNRALGYEAGSYPETTGAALLAFRGYPAAKLQSSLACARAHAAHTKTAEAWSWLTLGLRAHGIQPALPAPDPGHQPRENALMLWALSAEGIPK